MRNPKPKTLKFLERNKDSIYSKVAKYAELHPLCRYSEIAKAVCSGDHKSTKKYLQHLADLGHKPSIGILGILSKRHPAFIEEQQKIADGLKKYPDLNGVDLSKKINVTARKIYKHLEKNHKGPVKKKLRSFMTPANVRRRRVLKYFKKNPTATPTVIAKALGESQSSVMKDIKKLGDEYRAQAVDEMGLIYQFINDGICNIIKRCENKLDEITTATHGGHIMEVELRAFSDLAQLHHLKGHGNNNIIIENVHITKEQRDACTMSVLDAQNISNELNWKKMKIPVPASKQIVDVSLEKDGGDNGGS